MMMRLVQQNQMLQKLTAERDAALAEAARAKEAAAAATAAAAAGAPAPHPPVVHAPRRSDVVRLINDLAASSVRCRG